MAGFFSPLISRVGAAAGCDLLIWILKTRSKDRSLRQLLRAMAAGQTGHANFHVFTCHREKTERRLHPHWTYR
ncbi:hypothetical protein EMIT0232MI5_90100 [Pseudomonas sp. IT-232MI5]